jgi:DUF4097 and DUF4098 domain-containing protein YvlB
MKLSFAMTLLLAASVAGAQESSTQQVFNGHVASGAWLRIRSHKGDIRVTESSGSTVTVTARTRYRYEDSDKVTYEVKRDGSNVTICSITVRTRRCDEEGYDSRGYRDRGDRNDRGEGSADFTVSLPRGVKLLASTGNGEVDVRGASSNVRASSGNGEVNVSGGTEVQASSGNGEVSVEGAQGEVEASTGNGTIRVRTSTGPVSAHTGNGSIDVEMRSLSKMDDMDFTTGNGSITVAFPSNLSARIDANGSFRNFETEFPLDMGRGFSGNHIRGTIGRGDANIRLSTGNGQIRLRKI